MSKNGPFWHTKLNNNLFFLYQALALALIIVISILAFLINDQAARSLYLIQVFSLSFMSIYLLDLFYNFTVLKIRNKMVFKTSYDIRHLISGLLIALFIPESVSLFLIAGLCMAAIISKRLLKKYFNTLHIDLGLFVLTIIYILSFVFNYNMLPLVFSYINLAYIVTTISILVLFLLIISNLIKPKLVWQGMILFLLTFLLLNYFNLITFNHLFLIGIDTYFVFITINSENTPTVPRSMDYYLIINMIVILIAVIFKIEYFLMLLLATNLLFGLLRDYVDILGLKSNKT